MRAVIACAVMVTAALSLVSADYPTPNEADFHHCALIYDADERGPEELSWYVANDGGWLFDAFLFLHQRAKSGARTMSGMTVRSDWEGQLDRWFTPGRDLDALNAAIADAHRAHGPVAPRRVIFSIPYPHPKVTDFGDVDGDGMSESLATEEGRDAVARWYIAEAIRRFEEANLPHLELWGLYWMNEGAHDRDIAVARRFSDAVHAAGKRMLWIPWFKATNWHRWREMGIDVAIMQPNYAFLTTHRGAVRRNRLIVNARAAMREGLGVEIELPMGWYLPGAARLFRHYLRDGTADREGYQQAATAYYLGRDSVEQMATSDDPAARAIYDDLATYVRGGTVAEPDPTIDWQVAGEAAPWLGDHLQDEGRPIRSAEAELPDGTHTSLDVMLHEPGDSWSGTVLVDGRSVPDGAWKRQGWALRARGSERDEQWQVVTVPLMGTARHLRVRFEGGESGPNVSELTPQPPLFEGATHLARDAPYSFSHPPEARYGDQGGELTDGRIPETGFPSGETVGWWGERASITFDLEERTSITRAEVHLQGGSVAAVNWPSSAIMMASNEVPARRTSGRGPDPENLTWLGAEPLVIDRRRSESDLDGHLTFRPEQPLRARYVTFILQPVGHLMLSEIRIFSGGENVAAGREYELQPPPTGERAPESYPDDGRKLTDGQITGFAPRAVVGWRDDEERTVIVDLQDLRRVDEVLVWTLTGSRYGIVPLASASVALSEDGEDWREFGEARPEEAPEDPSTACAATVDTGGAHARFVRVTARRDEGWAMLSEIEVRGEWLP